jgi:hypothetical protein
MNKINKSDEQSFELLLRERKFEKPENDLARIILKKTEKIRGTADRNSISGNRFFFNLACVSACVLISGIIFGYCFSPVILQNNDGVRDIYIQEFLYPQGVNL